MSEPRSGNRSAILQGWGRTTPVRSRVRDLDPATVGELVRSVGPRGILARGLGRSYGDAAQNAGGLVLLPSQTQMAVDSADRTVDVSAGTSLHDLINGLLPHGLFLPVTPGTRQVSVGGAIAADVHGKNHYRDGSFTDHVVSFELVGPDGRTVPVTPEDQPELFWTTAGGMGLTGVITRAVLRARTVDSAYLEVTHERLPDLATLLHRMREQTRTRAYAAAWVDLTARGRSLGRSVLSVADHAAQDLLSDDQAEDAFALPRASRLRVSGTPPSSLLTPRSVRAFNEVWFRRAPAHPTTAVEHLSGFFHQLDAIEGWNRFYGPHGLVQYQFGLPDDAEDVLERALRLISASGSAPFLGVLKRMGPANGGWLSFPGPGWSLAADFPASSRLIGLFRALDELVIEGGGRVYLAKDSTSSPETARRMYPRATDFRTWREATGTHPVFVSDLSRRLNL